MNELKENQKLSNEFNTKTPVKEELQIPYAVLCELTHRCPLSCPYCSNPIELEMKSREIDTETWKKALSEAVKIGILQAHFSGGEPTARKDLEELLEKNIIAGVPLGSDYLDLENGLLLKQMKATDHF